MTAEDSRMSQYNKQTVDKLRKPGGKKRNAFVGNSHFIPQIAITSWTPRGKNLGHGWSRRIYP